MHTSCPIPASNLSSFREATGLRLPWFLVGEDIHETYHYGVNQSQVWVYKVGVSKPYLVNMSWFDFVPLWFLVDQHGDQKAPAVRQDASAEMVKSAQDVFYSLLGLASVDGWMVADHSAFAGTKLMFRGILWHLLVVSFARGGGCFCPNLFGGRGMVNYSHTGLSIWDSMVILCSKCDRQTALSPHVSGSAKRVFIVHSFQKDIIAMLCLLPAW